VAVLGLSACSDFGNAVLIKLATFHSVNYKGNNIILTLILTQNYCGMACDTPYLCWANYNHKLQ
jgi:hypothetical protein